MELELKHLAPYLPYGLKFEHVEYDYSDKVNHNITKMESLSADLITFEDCSDYYFDADNCDGYNPTVVPLLLPMSSLYTEMEDGKVPMKVIGEMLEYDLKKYVSEDGEILYGFDLTDTSIPYIVPMEDREIYFIYFDTQSHWFYMVNQFLEVDSFCEHIPFNLQVSDYLDSLHFDWRYGLIDKGLALDKTKIK